MSILTCDYKLDNMASFITAAVADALILASINMTRLRKSYCLVALIKMPAHADN